MGFIRMASVPTVPTKVGLSARLKPLLLLLIRVLGASAIATKVEAAALPEFPDFVANSGTTTLPTGYTYTSSNVKVATVSGLTMTIKDAGATVITAESGGTKLELPLLVLTELKGKSGSTRVSRWKDDKTGVFNLMFDDGHASHVSQVIPNLNSRGMTATFYLNPSSLKNDSPFLNNSAVVCGNHTWDHHQLSAPTDDAAAKEQIKPTQDFFKKNIAGKWPRLISFARPGSTPQPETLESNFKNRHPGVFDRLMNNFNLINRPPFGSGRAGGCPASAKYNYITNASGALAVADLAINNKKIEYIIFHAIEEPGKTKKPLSGFTFEHSEFITFLDGLKSRMDNKKLWVTDHISSYQYDQEFRDLTIKAIENTSSIIRFNVSHQKDQNLYDLPLTFTTRVPASWTVCRLIEGGKPAKEVTIKDSVVTYDAHMGEVILKSGTIISLKPTVSFVTVDQSKAEDAGVATMTIQLSAVSAETVTVPFAVTGTATAPSDYTINASPVIISAGATSASITITINDDSLVEKSEAVQVTLLKPTNATLGAAKTNTLTITDNDVAAGGKL